MSIFNIFKKKIEIKEEPVVEEKKEETPPVEVKRFDLPIDTDARINLIASLNDKIDNEVEKTLQDYYVCKIFSRAVIILSSDIERFKTIDIQLKDALTSIEKAKEAFTNKTDVSLDDLYNIYEMMFDAFDDLVKAKDRIIELKNDKYANILISSISPLFNKNSTELSSIDKKIDLYLAQYKSLNDAADNIYLNSGDVIQHLVHEIVEYVRTSNNQALIEQYNSRYFIESDVVLALSDKDWISLYNKITYCIKKLKTSEIASLISALKYFSDFEVRYIILMIQFEKKRV